MIVFIVLSNRKLRNGPTEISIFVVLGLLVEDIWVRNSKIWVKDSKEKPFINIFIRDIFRIWLLDKVSKIATKRYCTDIWINSGTNKSEYLKSFKMQEEFLKQLYRLLFHRIFDDISQKHLCFKKTYSICEKHSSKRRFACLAGQRWLETDLRIFGETCSRRSYPT